MAEITAHDLFDPLEKGMRDEGKAESYAEIANRLEFAVKAVNPDLRIEDESDPHGYTLSAKEMKGDPLPANTAERILHMPLYLFVKDKEGVTVAVIVVSTSRKPKESKIHFSPRPSEVPALLLKAQGVKDKDPTNFFIHIDEATFDGSPMGQDVIDHRLAFIKNHLISEADNQN